MTAGEGPRRRGRGRPLLSRGTVAGSPVIAVELLLFGTWGLVVPYLGRSLGFAVDTRPGVEVIDHVVPGVLVIGAALLAILGGGRSLLLALAALAAGVWMTATHIPLLRQASDGQVTWSAALWHSTPGMVILALGAVALALDVLAAPATARAGVADPPTDVTGGRAGDGGAAPQP